jgi:UDP:flavonoid glycosyltransferase YjiC (YdhE family)
MQMEQVANLAALERLGFAIRVPKSRNPSAKVQDAIQKLIRDESAKAKAAAFAKAISEWDAPRLAAERLFERYASPI